MPGIGSKPPPLIRPSRPGTVGRRAFPAQYAGACASCGAAILPGDGVFFAAGNEAVSGIDCCGDKDAADLVVHERRDTEDEALTVELGQVMPRGRTARDACPKCWTVPANNGTCGCDT